MDLEKLINWAEGYFKEKKDLAHRFRRLRNNIHKDEVHTEHEALEAVVYVTDLINRIHYFRMHTLTLFCPLCNQEAWHPMENYQLLLGHSFSIRCGGCLKYVQFFIGPWM